MTTGREVVAGGRPHRVGGAQAAVIREGRVLVQLRLWPPGWELPGGHLGPDEDPADCAVREVEEETGMRVRLVGLVGVYYWEGLRTTADALYAVEPVGGAWRRSLESLAVRWVDMSSLPTTLFPWYLRRIDDALAGRGTAAAVVRTQPVTLRHVLFFGSRWAAAPVDQLRRRRPRRRA